MSRITPDVFNPNCESWQVLELLADRWSMLVILRCAQEPAATAR